MVTTAKIPRFRQCSQCGFDLLTRAGERACHYYGCPYLPEELDATCPVCMYDFMTRDGNPECGDPPSCAFALEEAPIRVANVHAWATEHGRETP